MTDPRWSTAVHEAAHAVVARALGRGVVRVTIEADADSHGHVRTTPFPDGFDPAFAYYDARVRRRVEDQIMVACAGGIAEGRVNQTESEVLWGSQNDYDNAHDLALWASSGDGDEAAAYVDWLRLRTFRIVWNPIWWDGIESLGRALLVQPTMTGRQAREAIQAGLNAHLAKARGKSASVLG